MTIVIIEDEELAARRLENMIRQFDPTIKVAAVIESLKEGVAWFSKNEEPDLIFLDIHLEDGLSFALFDQVSITAPIIFTTAFDEYAIKAFKLKSIDYLLKPVTPEDLAAAIRKYQHWHAETHPALDTRSLYELLTRKEPEYKTRFSIVTGQKIRTITIDEVAYFYAEEGMVFLVTNTKASLPVDYTLDQLGQMLNPKDFFRINRQFIIRLQSIEHTHIYPKSKLRLELKPATRKEVFVSLDRVTKFKEWLDA